MNTNESRRKLIEIFAAVGGAVVAKHFEMHRVKKSEQKGNKQRSTKLQYKNGKMFCVFFLSRCVYIHLRFLMAI